MPTRQFALCGIPQHRNKLLQLKAAIHALYLYMKPTHTYLTEIPFIMLRTATYDAIHSILADTTIIARFVTAIVDI